MMGYVGFESDASDEDLFEDVVHRVHFDDVISRLVHS